MTVTPTPQNVFPIVGKPTFTYVAQGKGGLEKRLKDSLLSKGQICLLTGPSKLGKTTVYRKVLSELNWHPVVIRCTEGMTVRNFWASALEDLNFEQINEKIRKKADGFTLEAGGAAEIGWSWIAKIIPSVKVTGSESNEISYRAAVVKSDLTAKNLIPLLQKIPVMLVVEDFHYLTDPVKREIFQQWKAFADEEVTVLVVSTTHHASDIARSNPDLRGRTRHIEVDKWDREDLELIAKKGFDTLGIRGGSLFKKMIATESCGQPIVTQQICQTFSLSLDLSPSSNDRRKDFQPIHLKPIFDKVISDFYSDYERDYERLLAGPRSGSRKYDTYGAILGAFALEPLEFSLRKQELISRVQVLSDNARIPLASIASSLTALAGHQRRMGTMLLEWQSNQDMLHIVEPSFLFFLRQKLKESGKTSDIPTLLKELLSQIKEVQLHLALPKT